MAKLASSVISEAKKEDNNLLQYKENKNIYYPRHIHNSPHTTLKIKVLLHTQSKRKMMKQAFAILFYVS